MSFEEILRVVIAEQVEPLRTALENALKALGKTDEGGEDWIKPRQAAKLLGCDTKHVNKLIDSGFLSLCYLPGTTRGDRRISKQEVLELKKKYTVCEKTRYK